MIEKEAQAWGMDTLGQATRDYQCINCGEIHSVQQNRVFDLGDDVYYATYCSRCKEVVKHLDVGADKTEHYLWVDPILDKRYY